MRTMWLLLLLLGLPRLLLASGEPPLAQLDELVVKEGFRTAEALRQGGQLEAALLVLRMTYERVPTPFLLWPMAQLSEQLRRPLAGLKALADYVEKLPPSEPPEPGQPDAAEVDRLRGRLRAQVASLRVLADEPGALVLVDGRQLGRTPLAGPVEVDPGRHRIEARGTRLAAAELTLSPGEQREVRLRTSVVAPPPSRQGGVVARWVLLGLGAAALAAGGALLGQDAACARAPSCPSDTRTPGLALVGGGAGVLGAAALLIGLEVGQQGGGWRGLRRVLGREPRLDK
ncbi:MAG: PEGA domain-containing protein [Myxococcales bacterium]|nr:PEGA domain-containing protein [Myxococcota bacterium]MDW8284058.1 PEGA domain-containing protein [Myxococcales bacterium]